MLILKLLTTRLHSDMNAGPNSEFETNWLQEIPFSRELPENYWL